MSKIAEACKELIDAESSYQAALAEETAANKALSLASEARKKAGKSKEDALNKVNEAKNKVLAAV